MREIKDSTVLEGVISDSEVLVRALKIKALEKAEKERLEALRVEDVMALIDAVYDLVPESSASIEDDLILLAKAKDFKEHSKFVFKGALNVCYYNGVKVTILKENGTISVKSLPYSVFVKFFKCHLSKWLSIKFKGCSIPSSSVGAEQTYSVREKLISRKAFKGGSKVNDVNNASILKHGLDVKGLRARNRFNKVSDKLEARKKRVAAKALKTSKDKK